MIKECDGPEEGKKGVEEKEHRQVHRIAIRKTVLFQAQRGRAAVKRTLQSVQLRQGSRVTSCRQCDDGVTGAHLSDLA